MTLALHGKSGRRKAVLLVAALAAILLAVAGGTVLQQISLVSAEPGPGKLADDQPDFGIGADVFLLIDEDTIDNGISQIEAISFNFPFCGGTSSAGPGNPSTCVNDDDNPTRDRRIPLFTRHYDARPLLPDLVLPAPTGSDRGIFWFTRNDPQTAKNNLQFTVPQLIAASGNTAGSGSNLLDEVQGVEGLNAAQLASLVGKTVCALVYDSDLSWDSSKLEANMNVAAYGLTAFTVIAFNSAGDNSTITIRVHTDMGACAAAPQDRQIRVVKIVEGEGSSLDPEFDGTITGGGNWSLQDGESQVFTRPTSNQTVVETENLATLSASDPDGTWSFGGYAQISQGYASNADAVAACRALSSGSFSGTQAGGHTTSGTGNLTVCVKNKFTPDERDADVRISISPLDDANEVGSNHVLTILLEKQIDGGAWQAFDGEQVTASLTNTLGATATFVGSPSCTTDSDGECTVTINSPTAGTTTVEASWAGGTVNTVAVGAKATDPDAVKRWVAVRIEIEPDGVNLVGDPHVFTVKLEVSVEHNVWTPLSGKDVDVEILSGPGDLSAASCTTDAAGECDVTLTSGVTGTTVVKASWSGVAADAQISEKTDTATKDWIQPEQRAIRVLKVVEVDGDGSAPAVSFDGIFQDIDPAGSPIDWDGGDGLAHGESESFLRDQGGTHYVEETEDLSLLNGDGEWSFGGYAELLGTATVAQCLGADYSGNLDQGDGIETSAVNDEDNITICVKNVFTPRVPEVDVRILITPLDEANEVGTNHVLTITLQYQIDGGEWTALNGQTVTASLTNHDGATAGFVGPNSCTTGSTGNGQCQVTISSPTAGSTTIEATWAGGDVQSVTVGARTTNPDANKDWVAVRLLITPLEDVNPVGTTHTFTITLQQSVVAGTWTPLNGELISVSFTVNTAGATFVGGVDTCTTGATGPGQCQVTITAPNEGTSTVQATWAGGTVAGASITSKSASADKDWEEVDEEERIIRVVKVVEVDGEGTAPSAGFDGTFDGTAWTLFNNDFRHFIREQGQSHHVEETEDLSQLDGDWEFGGYAELPGLASAADCRAANYSGSPAQAAGINTSAGTSNITVCVRNIFTPEDEPELFTIRIVKVVDQGEGTFTGTLNSTNWSLDENSYDDFLRAGGSYTVTENALPANWIFEGYAVLNGLPADPIAACQGADYSASPTQAQGINVNVTGDVTVCVSNIFDDEVIAPSAPFIVKKTFDDGSTHTVTVKLECTSGTVTPATLNIAPGNPGTFIVTDFTGELDDVECTATEVNVPTGYTSTACKATLEDGECTIENKKIADAATPIPPKAGSGFGGGGSTSGLTLILTVLGLMAITLGAASTALVRRPRTNS